MFIEGTKENKLNPNYNRVDFTLFDLLLLAHRFYEYNIIIEALLTSTTNNQAQQGFSNDYSQSNIYYIISTSPVFNYNIYIKTLQIKMISGDIELSI